MKVVLAGYGSRGDVEPVTTVARELLGRGHDVQIAVAPNMIPFVESAGVAAVAYGPDTWDQMDSAAGLVGNYAANIDDPVVALNEMIQNVNHVKAAKTATLTTLAEGADMLVAGFNEQGLAANVAEYHDIPLAALHFFPRRVWSSWQMYAQLTKQTDAAQRAALNLPKASALPAPLEIQAYDELCLPGPAAEWVDADGRHPFVGALTLELQSGADDEVLAWIADATPPIYFGFGSTPIASPAETVAVISAACARLGERALICSGPNDFSAAPRFDHTMVVSEVSHAAAFPVCRAVAHHGGAGVTAAALRAGVPNLILWFWLDQPMWADGVARLEAGAGRAFSESTLDSLTDDLRRVLTPECAARAREVAAQMTKPADSVTRAIDLLEAAAGVGSPSA
ncbi:glycosyl transferase [Mycobacterium rhizamassiliense]|uniref:Glycosyl transferase n=1 Tax=Mycobacterium rhizamassiliense TaxID=1841860 RepID=A0A2U3NYG8_9MYCO|nr:glycosyltransferase [Mycobacterium rhizamassiliense]SPM36532.1 glycosyl transferase [Mycobacterium rhizamassiliense]